MGPDHHQDDGSEKYKGGVRADSGGPGRNRGGMGFHRDTRYLNPLASDDGMLFHFSSSLMY